jgi:hypothetical protein
LFILSIMIDCRRRHGDHDVIVIILHGY